MIDSKDTKTPLPVRDHAMDGSHGGMNKLGLTRDLIAEGRPRMRNELTYGTSLTYKL